MTVLSILTYFVGMGVFLSGAILYPAQGSLGSLLVFTILPILLLSFCLFYGLAASGAKVDTVLGATLVVMAILSAVSGVVQLEASLSIVQIIVAAPVIVISLLNIKKARAH